MRLNRDQSGNKLPHSRFLVTGLEALSLLLSAVTLLEILRAFDSNSLPVQIVGPKVPVLARLLSYVRVDP